jgi:hypothetical protein
VLPYYLPVITFASKHLLYFCLNGNVVLALVIAYLFNYPYYGKEAKQLR